MNHRHVTTIKIQRCDLVIDILAHPSSKMAALLRSLKRVEPGFVLKLARISKANISYDAGITIADFIEHKRENAALGGGQRRIDNQHMKVSWKRLVEYL